MFYLQLLLLCSLPTVARKQLDYLFSFDDAGDLDLFFHDVDNLCYEQVHVEV
jgi:hypothetical protein